MKILASAAAALLTLAIAGCSPPESMASARSSPALHEQIHVDDLMDTSLETTMLLLDDAEISYEVREQATGRPYIKDPKAASEKGKWKSVLVADQSGDTLLKGLLSPGDSVQIIVRSQVASSPTPTPTPTPSPEIATLTYVVEADGPIESVTFSTELGGNKTEEKVTAPGSSFSKEISLTPYQVSSSHMFSVSAWPGAGTTTISCKILVDGVARDSGSLTGSSSFVQCADITF